MSASLRTNVSPQRVIELVGWAILGVRPEGTQIVHKLTPRTEGQKNNDSARLPESCVTLDLSCPSWKPQRVGEGGRGRGPVMLTQKSNPDHPRHCHSTWSRKS